jgi:hypothetical protein
MTQTDKGLWASFSVETNSEIVCITNISPYGPSFEMKGLPAGEYPITISVLPACAFPSSTGALCDIAAPQWNPTDTLVVVGGDTFPKIWVNPKETKIEEPFILELWSNGLNCSDVISNKSVKVEENQIQLSYDVQVMAVGCLTVVVDTKVEFEIPALKAGTYQVVLNPPEDCPSSAFVCEEKWKDTSIAAFTLGNKLTAGIHGKTSPNQSAYGKIRKVGERLEIEVPESLRTIGIEASLLDMQGRVLARTYTQVGQVSLQFEGVNGMGLHFIRFGKATSPAQLQKVFLSK